MSDCEVCDGKGEYGIVTARGSWWGTITCPGCLGSGLDPAEEEEADLEDEMRHEERLAAAWDIIRQNASSRLSA